MNCQNRNFKNRQKNNGIPDIRLKKICDYKIKKIWIQANQIKEDGACLIIKGMEIRSEKY